METSASFKPKQYHTLTPYFIIKNAARALNFYKEALNAEELYRLDLPDGKIGHAELKIGDSIFMLSDEFPEMNTLSPQSLGGSAVSTLIYVEDVDKSSQQALKAGMKVRQPVKDQIYGDRAGTFEDPFGHIWTLATNVENVPIEVVRQRIQELYR
jgi:PhnB protein